MNSNRVLGGTEMRRLTSAVIVFLALCGATPALGVQILTATSGPAKNSGTVLILKSTLGGNKIVDGSIQSVLQKAHKCTPHGVVSWEVPTSMSSHVQHFLRGLRKSGDPEQLEV